MPFKPKTICAAAILLLCASFTHAQTCEVLADSIRGTYTGACAKGKANGEGKSVGRDTYEGGFKNGLPDGTGKYTWGNTGSYYTGKWKKGLQDGAGEMHVIGSDGKESVTTGFWTKGEYRGIHEFPYKIFNVTPEVGRVQVAKIKSVPGGGSVRIRVESIMGGGSLVSSTNMPSVRMTDFRITGGSYLSKATSPMTNSEVTSYMSVVFPFRGIFYFGSSMIDIELYEEGNWEITVPVGR